MSIINAPLNNRKSQGITTIRFILACYVVMVHMVPWYDLIFANIPHIVTKGVSLVIKFFQPASETNPAVLAFITLSGYCIHRNGLRIDKFDLGFYSKRRFFRIFPIFLFGSVIGACVFLICDSPDIRLITGTEHVTIFDLLTKLTGLGVFYPKLHAPSFLGNAALTTVAVEIWLYAFYPLGLVLFDRWGSKKFLALLFTLPLVGALMTTLHPNSAGWWHNGSFFGFLTFWWIGVFILDDRFWGVLKKYSLGALLCYLGLTFMLIFMHPIPLVTEFRKILFCLLFGYLLKTIDVESVKKTVTRLPKFFLGDILESSYSLYAIHVPILVLSIGYGINPIYAFVLCISIGYITYKIVEKPMSDVPVKRYLVTS